MAIQRESCESYGYRYYGIPLDYLMLSSIIIGITILYLFYKRLFRQIRIYESAELEEILKTFNPEPLITSQTDDKKLNVQSNVITGRIGPTIKINNIDYINFASHNHLNLVANQKIKADAINTIKKYGVGSCGPRGFYGTVDVHLDLEQRIATFMKMEEAAVYSYWFSAIASAIPAYCKRNDVMFVDEMISFPAKKGMDAAKCTVIYFKHNDPKDLETKIKAYNNKISKKSQHRKFLLLEGIYSNTGNICNLPPLIELRNKYKMRLFLDETFSIGVLGKTGRGITEHFKINKSEVDMIMGSLEGIVGSIGGFCVGSHFIIEHQRLSGLGYCFSASLPPVLTRAAYCAFDYLDENHELLHKFNQKCATIHAQLVNIPNVQISGHEWSPIKYLILIRNGEPINDNSIYQKFVENCKNEGLIVGLMQNIGISQWQIKLCINIDLTEENIQKTVQILCSVTENIV